MKKITFALLIMITASSCSLLRKQKVVYIESIRDSIVYRTKTEYKDTTLYIQIPAETKRDTVIISDYNYSEKSILKNKFSTSVAQVKKGRLEHTLSNNDTIIPFYIKNAVRATWCSAERFNSSVKVKEVVKTKTPAWAYYSLAILGIIIISLAYIIRLVKK